MTLYRYSGPPSGATVDGKEVLLHPGADVDLPRDNDYVRTLVALGHLAPVPVSAGSGTDRAPRRATKSEGAA
ncbi:hypothetical protein [Azospirillum halopraeferens]|uniref:hypothetical protein n=1 Tax=Azospirillum halopraeferens TaxID=34010 RepID=UPI000410BF24|nr:hypothetical protein [Azospirillum halopraeferens]